MNKYILGFVLTIIGIATAGATNHVTLSEDSGKVYGVAFYNLENLFDTINANGRYDLEFSPEGARKWDTRKYNIKLNNIANAIAGLVSKAEALP